MMLVNSFRFGGGGGAGPTLVSATINTAGTQLSLVFSAAVKVGTGGNAGWTISMSGGAATLSFLSGGGSTTLVYTISRTVTNGEVGTVAYAQPGDGIEANTGGADVATIATAGVTNNSTAGSSIALVQSKSGKGESTGTPTITTGVPPVTGNLMVLVITSDNVLTSFAGWNPAATNVDSSGCYIYFRTAGASEPSTFGPVMPSGAFTTLNYSEWSGLVSNALDQSANASPHGSLTSLSTGTTGNTIQANELVIGAVGLVASAVSSWTNGFSGAALDAGGTNQTTGGGGVRVAVVYKIVSATGTYETTATFSPATGGPSGLIATFQ